jgi:hypothetical protein
MTNKRNSHYNFKLLFLAFFHIILGIIIFPSLAFSYIGPGAGLTMLGALWAVLIAIVFAISGLLIWPIRALIRRKKVNNSNIVETKED